MAKHKLRSTGDFEIVRSLYEGLIDAQEAINELAKLRATGRCVLTFHGFGIGVPIETVSQELTARRQDAVSRLAEWGLEVEFTE